MTKHNDEITENGIKSDHPDVSIERYQQIHGEPIVENDQVVIFADRYGYDTNEWAELLDIDRSDLADRMYELAREHSDESQLWGAADPIVFDSGSV